ncbi:MAG: flagellar basal body P-ring formation chaperone FlgA [bacterium]
MSKAARIIMVFLLLAACGGWAGAAGRISLKPHSEVSGNALLLGKMATLEGFSEEEQSRLASLSLGAAPSPARNVKLNPGQVKSRLYNAGLDLDAYELDIPPQVVVERTARVVTGEEIANAAVAFLEKNFPTETKTFKVIVVGTPQDIILPEGEVEFHPVLDVRPERVGLSGFRMDVVQDGVVKRTVGLQNALDIEVEVVAATRKISAGETLTADDVVMKSARVSRLRGGALFDPGDVVGKRIRRFLSEGSAIPRNAVEMVPDVNIGDRVNLVVRSGFVEVTAQGKALEKGLRGDTIRVLNLNTKKILDAEIIDPGNVRVLTNPE